jgi:hypothetical protein
MPLEKLMEDIAASGLSGKFVIATLNQAQYMSKDNYWAKELNRWGFVLSYKANNDIGSTNYIYIRNPKVVAIQEGEH